MTPAEVPDELSQTILDTWATVANPFGDQRESDAALMRMRTALEAVLEDHKPRTRATHTGCRECGQLWPCNTLRAIEAALTTDTKGDAR